MADTLTLDQLETLLEELEPAEIRARYGDALAGNPACSRMLAYYEAMDDDLAALKTDTPAPPSAQAAAPAPATAPAKLSVPRPPPRKTLPRVLPWALPLAAAVVVALLLQTNQVLPPESEAAAPVAPPAHTERPVEDRQAQAAEAPEAELPADDGVEEAAGFAFDDAPATEQARPAKKVFQKEEDARARMLEKKSERSEARKDRAQDGLLNQAAEKTAPPSARAKQDQALQEKVLHPEPVPIQEERTQARREAPEKEVASPTEQDLAEASKRQLDLYEADTAHSVQYGADTARSLLDEDALSPSDPLGLIGQTEDKGSGDQADKIDRMSFYYISPEADAPNERPAAPAPDAVGSSAGAGQAATSADSLLLRAYLPEGVADWITAFNAYQGTDRRGDLFTPDAEVHTFRGDVWPRLTLIGPAPDDGWYVTARWDDRQEETRLYLRLNAAGRCVRLVPPD